MSSISGVSPIVNSYPAASAGNVGGVKKNDHDKDDGVSSVAAPPAKGGSPVVNAISSSLVNAIQSASSGSVNKLA